VEEVLAEAPSENSSESNLSDKSFDDASFESEEDDRKSDDEPNLQKKDTFEKEIGLEDFYEELETAREGGETPSRDSLDSETRDSEFS
jgi:hypothetical protein